jgi:hypothetical protein
MWAFADVAGTRFSLTCTLHWCVLCFCTEFKRCFTKLRLNLLTNDADIIWRVYLVTGWAVDAVQGLALCGTLQVTRYERDSAATTELAFRRFFVDAGADSAACFTSSVLNGTGSVVPADTFLCNLPTIGVRVPSQRLHCWYLPSLIHWRCWWATVTSTSSGAAAGDSPSPALGLSSAGLFCWWRTWNAWLGSPDGTG